MSAGELCVFEPLNMPVVAQGLVSDQQVVMHPMQYARPIVHTGLDGSDGDAGGRRRWGVDGYALFQEVMFDTLLSQHQCEKQYIYAWFNRLLGVVCSRS